MPEGDTVHTLARELDRRLSGCTLAAGRLRDAPSASLAGCAVRAVRARGKHLLVELARGDGGALVLRSHLGMHGSWHRYRPGERWQRPSSQASIVLETERDVLVCFRAEEVELCAGDARAFELRRRLGPDLIAEEPELTELLARARHFLEPDAPLADLLLDQRVASGIGNVYKSELCFLAGLHPARAWSSVDEPVLARVYADARRLLQANVGGGPRRTRAPASGGARASLWVYRRKGRPCLRCAAPIESARLGRGARSTYWCPRCQPR